ncbi:sulfotransferase 1C4-like [Diabrotica virgifera virgifera]|uniref:Sulfotransferase domain-containing protein n=1 Tax=Diabrotica virgifera virgifera TaxID=50390 RepID=A0ABM5JKU7_DIAVI|nr:sulfotransferase 1C4-like [Diabrotica virgifera virgifera]
MLKMPPTPTYIENVSDKSDGKKKTFPYEIVQVCDKTNQELLNFFKGEKDRFLQIGPKKWLFPSGYEAEAANYYNFSIRPDDVFIVTFPRSGTTLTQEMVWLLENNLDYSTAAGIPLKQRFPFLEFSSFVHKKMMEQFLEENQSYPERCAMIENLCYPRWKHLQGTNGRRFIKTHLPLSLLPPNLLDSGAKVIYVARNPKDVAVSYYHLCRAHRTQGFTGDFAQFWNFFQSGLVSWAPYWEHIKEGWSRRHESNLIFLFYEDMNKNLDPVLQKLSKFLGKSYSTEELSHLSNHLSIDNFKNNKSVNNEDFKDLGILNRTEGNFVRSGNSGGWRSYFDDEINGQADKWIEENLRLLNIEFPK